MRSARATPGATAAKTAGHRPVLLHPLIESLQPKQGDIVVDGTLGAGGVCAALLERVLPAGRVIAIDRDPEAVELGRKRFASFGDAVVIVHGDYAECDQILERLGLHQVDVITFDLGISSLQLDDPRRGFSFQVDGPLDMRMDTNTGLTAADILNSWTTEDLAEVIRSYSDERFARSIAKSIGESRAQRPITTTLQLRTLIERTIPRRFWPKRIHPATRTFQALRIAVNDELDHLEVGLQAAIRSLRPGGRFGVISFHSFEDTLVKNAFHVAATNCLCPPQQPVCTCAHRASLFLPSRRAIKPDADEIAANPRSRSARLRVAVKL